jgi:PAS domain S-box-containing protein
MVPEWAGSNPEHPDLATVAAEHATVLKALCYFVLVPPKIARPGAALKARVTVSMTQDLSEPANAELAKLRQECEQLEMRLDAQGAELTLLRARFARYEAALRGSQVTVYTQDRNLRYTSLSNPMLGRSIEDILGRTDEDILPPDGGRAVIVMKRETLASGQPKRAEVAIESASGQSWFDLHIEPLRNEAGNVVGLTCAAINITQRKESEAHLRLLMRELTHRSKNLLAVIQGMARQTARHAGSTEGFLNQFAARLQALAASHDLLVNESWYGVSLRELIQSQVAATIAGGGSQVDIEGPPIALKPEAAQNLGLALHELAANAATFGSLSLPAGRVSVAWTLQDRALAIEWRERGGPMVKVRRKKGFGSMVIERNLTRSLDAKVELTFEPDGLRCHILIPAGQILAAR